MPIIETPILLDSPSRGVSSGAAGFANRARSVPAFSASEDVSLEAVMRVPQNYLSGGAVVVTVVANATAGAARWLVSSAVAAAGASEDGVYTDEAAQAVAVPAAAKARLDVTFALATVPVAGATLNLKLTRQAKNAADTLAVDALLWEILFRYTGS